MPGVYFYEGVRQAVPLPTKYKRTDHDQFATCAHSFAGASVSPRGATWRKRLLSELLWTKDEFPEKQGLFYYQKVKSKYHT